jgi:hypothetical protein
MGIFARHARLHLPRLFRAGNHCRNGSCVTSCSDPNHWFVGTSCPGNVVTECQSQTICVIPERGHYIAGTGSEKEHRLKSDFKAASVLERLSTSLTDAEIGYQAGQGIHEFIVRLGGMRHVVDFSDDLMEKKNEMDLSVVILGIVQRASTQSMPVHFMVRNDNFDKLMQALKR